MYLHEDVFLDSKTAKRLYHEVAKDLPIIDYHTHLPQDEILQDKKFDNLWELWLKHDHYKWRLMRACGVAEHYITGDSTPFEKFEAFASIMPNALGNPVHHWAHFELKRVFSIDTILCKESAHAIWEKANSKLHSSISVGSLLEQFKVELVCTTDDPTANLTNHAQIAARNHPVTVLPTFRPDRFLANDQTAIEELSKITGNRIKNHPQLLEALHQRHTFFHQHGCRLSDHGLNKFPDPDTEAFDMLRHIAKWNKERGWTMQLHLGPMRTVNGKMFKKTGADSGFDTMGPWLQTEALIKGLDILNSEEVLGKTIIYNLNPMESEPICCAIQNFQSSDAKGLIQYGPAWWHLDHVRGIREQLDILTSLGAIGTSVGMLTDSRSFTSYVRHEYYRRLLCQYIGRAADAGEMPDDFAALSKLIGNICYNNPKEYFQWSSASTESHSTKQTENFHSTLLES